MEAFVLILILISFAVFGFFCSYIATQKNRDSVTWFWLGFFFNFLALIAIGVVPALASKKPKAGLRKCPSCAEDVKAEAKICRFCQAALPELVGMTDEQKMEKYKIVVENDLFVYRNSKQRLTKRFPKLSDAIRFAEHCEKL